MDTAPVRRLLFRREFNKSQEKSAVFSCGNPSRQSGRDCQCPASWSVQSVYALIKSFKSCIAPSRQKAACTTSSSESARPTISLRPLTAMASLAQS